MLYRVEVSGKLNGQEVKLAYYMKTTDEVPPPRIGDTIALDALADGHKLGTLAGRITKVEEIS